MILELIYSTNDISGKLAVSRVVVSIMSFLEILKKRMPLDFKSRLILTTSGSAVSISESRTKTHLLKKCPVVPSSRCFVGVVKSNGMVSVFWTIPWTLDESLFFWKSKLDDSRKPDLKSSCCHHLFWFDCTTQRSAPAQKASSSVSWVIELFAIIAADLI